MFGNSGAFTYSPGGFSLEDFPQYRRAAQQDEPRASAGQGQRSGMSRPSGRSIYLQRKEYSETLNRPSESFHVRVEHLFTGELDGHDMRTLGDCVAKLKTLDAKGRLWPQEMIMDVQGGYLLLTDIETKAELEALPLSSIVQTKAVLDSCAYNSLLTVTVQRLNKKQVFLFQCEETGAELVKSDLDKLIERGGSQADARTHPDNVTRQHSFRPSERIHFDEPDYPPRLRSATPPDDPSPYPERRESPDTFSSLGRAEVEKNVDILNHIIGDVEIFMGKVASSVKPVALQDGRSKNLKIYSTSSLPPVEEYLSYLQKVKFGFNLLGLLEDSLSNPSAPDYVHIFFTSLEQIVFQYPEDLPPTVVSPLLTDAAVELMERVVGPQENRFWKFLGEYWNIPRSGWNDTNVPPYVPLFYDGWQLPAPTYIPPSRNNVSQVDGPFEAHVSRESPWQAEQPVSNGLWDLPPPEPPLYMRAMYDFVARSSRELSIMAGEEVKVIQKSKQWWLVGNSRGEQGNVPQGILEPARGSAQLEDFLRDGRRSVNLSMTSSPAEVKAWLRHKGFSNSTLSTLGVLNGKILLEMSKNDMKNVCPEEGGKVFFQLQAVKSAIALASETSVYSRY